MLSNLICLLFLSNRLSFKNALSHLPLPSLTHSSYSLCVNLTLTLLPFLVISRFGFSTFFSFAVDDYLFAFAKFVHCFLTCNLACFSAIGRLPHLCVKRKNTRTAPIKNVLFLHLFSSLQLRLEAYTHNYAGCRQTQLKTLTCILCNTTLTLAQQCLFCF